MSLKFLNILVLWSTSIILFAHKTEGGFTHGAACSSRNTAYLNPSKPLFPQDPVKCVDITGMKSSLKFHNEWPIRQADTLYADHMDLTNISSIFTSMPNLELADFTGNKLRKLPYMVYRIAPGLTTLLLSSNRVRIPKKRPLIKSYTLQTLMLSHNKIRKLQTRTFARLPLLRVLYLDSNYLGIVTAKMFCHLTNLRYLHLGNNLLKHVPMKGQMPKSLAIYIVKGNDLEDEGDDLQA